MILQSPLVLVRRWLRGIRYYRCGCCGFEVLKSEAVLSGFPDDARVGVHVYCPACGEIVVSHLYWWRRR